LEFETWEEFESAILGAYGTLAQDEAMEQLDLGVKGAYGTGTVQAEYDEFLDNLQAGLADGTLAWAGASAGPGGDLGGFDPDELAAAEERVRDAETEEVLHDAVDALEERIGRPPTKAEIDQLITPETVQAAFDGGSVDFSDRADELKAKLNDRDGRLEIGASAVQRVGEVHDSGFDARELDGMSDRQLRVFQGEQAARFAREGGSPGEWEAAKEATLVAHEPDAVDHGEADVE
jgi:hypothetical protein